MIYYVGFTGDLISCLGYNMRASGIITYKARKTKLPRVLFFLFVVMVSLAYYNIKKADQINIGSHGQLDQLLEEKFSEFNAADKFFDTLVSKYDRLQKGENLQHALERMGLNVQYARRFSLAIGKVINLRAIHAGDVIMVEGGRVEVQPGVLGEVVGIFNQVSPTAVEFFKKGQDSNFQVVRAHLLPDASIKIEERAPKMGTGVSVISGEVENSIYSAILNGGGSSQLVNDFSDIFAWQVDFYRNTRKGDKYKILVEQNIADGRAVSYGQVLAAEYESNGQRTRGFYFESNDKKILGYFDDKGNSLRDAFLRAPLKIANIVSKFGMRYHPVQKRNKPHNGVDYGANRGTPIMAVCDGVVTAAGYNRFNGNWVRLKHLNGYETEYLHAESLVKGVKVGKKVEQGEVIAYVGKTGMATGYHLHFGMKRNGRYIDPAIQRLTKSPGVPSDYLAEFKSRTALMVAALNDGSSDGVQALALNQ